MKPSASLVVGLAALALAPLPALARPAFLRVARDQLHLGAAPTGVLSAAGCRLCHVNPEGGAPWNAFGLEVGRERARRLAIGEALFEALKLGEDADGDGYEDALELYAGTLPGDRQSHPSEGRAALRDRFLAAGGLAMFAPGAAR